jgi:hypothetical protein
MEFDNAIKKSSAGIKSGSASKTNSATAEPVSSFSPGYVLFVVPCPEILIFDNSYSTAIALNFNLKFSMPRCARRDPKTGILCSEI